MTIIVRKNNLIGCDSAYVKHICGELVTVYDRSKIFIHETGKAVIGLTGVIPGLNAFKNVMADINQLLLDVEKFPDITLIAENIKEYFKESKDDVSESNAFSVLIALPNLSIIIERRDVVTVEVHLPEDLITIGSGSVSVIANYYELNKHGNIQDILNYASWNDAECGGELFIFDLDDLTDKENIDG